MAPRGFADQPPAPVASTSGSNHFGVCSGLVDKDELAGIEACLIVFPRLTRLRYVGALLFGGVQSFFLKLIPCRLKKRRIERSLVTTPTPSRIRRSSSCKVKSGSRATSPSSQSL